MYDANDSINFSNVSRSKPFWEDDKVKFISSNLTKASFLSRILLDDNNTVVYEF